jgi:hypothetical protein
VLAHIADIPQLKQAFADGLDIHAMTASRCSACRSKGMPIRGAPPRQGDQFRHHLRHFGLRPRQPARHRAREEAGAYIKTYFERFPGIRDYMDATKKLLPRDRAMSTTIFGRACHYPRINSSNPSERAFNERAAINAPIQGSAADIIRRAMIRMPAALAAPAVGADAAAGPRRTGVRGGALSPLGDPPLFLGFLRGVDFFWTARNLWPQTLFMVACLLAIFYALDSWLYRKEGVVAPDPTPDSPLRLKGRANLALVAIVIAAIVASGVWKPGVGWEIAGTRLELQNLAREAVLVAAALVSLAVTPRALRAANGFEWEPIREVAILFAAIFLCIIPVMAMLHGGADGPFAPLISALRRGDGALSDPAFFWATGLLSSFLDNAPTYLVFFELAGGDAGRLTGPLAPTLAAISLGAVFMGALTYVGNAPNFMVYAIARRAGVNMPGFFGYMLWSAALLIPLFAALHLLFLR